MADLLMILSWSVFYSLHTLLASTKLKNILEVKCRLGMKRYRLFYTLFFVLLFLGIIFQILFLPTKILFQNIRILIYIGYLASAMGIIICSKSLKEISFSSFLGLSKGNTISDKLIIKGIYSYMRHPLYFGLLLIFSGYFLVSATVGSLIHLLCLVVYLPIGIYFEEKNLVQKYGGEYENYKKKVPSIFPVKTKKER
jgi:methanethiol S-methyltransferase